MENKHLPVFGVGPIYVVCCLTLTVIGIALRNTAFLKSGDIDNLKHAAIVIGLAFIILGVVIWIYAVVIQKISVEIKKGKLVTQGVYSLVRNPIYSAFFLVFTGALIIVHNVYLLILPIIFYLSLTFLMKNTEEKWLLEKFGNDYEEYCIKVNRVIPWWRK